MKKPSAANDSDKLLEGYTFLVEESLGRGVADRLSASGFRVVSQGRDIPTGLSDPDVFAIAGERRYVVLSKDLKTRTRPAEKAAMIQNKLAVFQLARGNWTGEEMAKAFIQAKHVIRRYLKKERPPFIVRLSKDGHVTVFNRLS